MTAPHGLQQLIQNGPYNLRRRLVPDDDHLRPTVDYACAGLGLNPLSQFAILAEKSNGFVRAV
jgi:hypothetical protein